MSAKVSILPCQNFILRGRIGVHKDCSWHELCRCCMGVGEEWSSARADVTITAVSNSSDWLGNLDLLKVLGKNTSQMVV